MKKLYYTVTAEVFPNGIQSGYRNIKVYQMLINKPKLLCKIRALAIDNGRGFETDDVEIQTWLDKNGYGEYMYSFEKL